MTFYDIFVFSCFAWGIFLFLTVGKRLGKIINIKYKTANYFVKSPRTRLLGGLFVILSSFIIALIPVLIFGDPPRHQYLFAFTESTLMSLVAGAITYIIIG